jgi:hypothetical protein
MSEPQTTLFLERNIFACPTKRHWVFLDLYRDKYLCLNRTEFDSLGIRFHGLAQVREDFTGVTPTSPSELVSLANELIKAGILTADPGHSKEVTPVDVLAPSLVLQPPLRPLTNTQLIGGLPAFLFACWKADRALRHNPIHKTIGDLIRRKQRARPTDMRDGSLDISRSISVFNSLRLLYPRPYLCLFDSLALFEMLSLYGDFPTLVFGVTTDPFNAHCWLQIESTVLNDSISTVRAYTPIMRV